MEQNKPSVDQALQNLAAVAAAYRGTAQEHDLLRLSLQVLADAVKVRPSE